MASFLSAKKLFSNLVLALVSILIFLFLTELVFRITGVTPQAKNLYFLLNPELDYPRFFKRDHGLFWKLKPNQVIKSDFFVEGEYRISSLGLRNREFSKSKPSGVFRIICLGNSNTFGWKQREEDAYPQQLQKLFIQNLPDSRIEVINAGITGYSSYQGKIFLQDEILKLRPDLILVNYGWNDLLPAKFGVPDKEQRLPPQWVLDLQNLLSPTTLYQTLRSFWVGRFASKKAVGPGVSRVSLDDFQQNLIQIETICRQNNLEAVFLTNPIASLSAHWGPGKISRTHLINQTYNAVILDLAQSHNFKVVDIAGLFEKRKDLYADPQADFIHYQALGHELVARAIYDYLLVNIAIAPHN